MLTSIGGVAVPAVYVDEVSSYTIGGAVVRAVDGTPHRSAVRIIRTWQLETRPLTHAEYQALDDMVNEAAGRAVAFHSDEWDAGVVNVFIMEFSSTRTLLPDDTAPGKNLRTVRFTLEEA